MNYIFIVNPISGGKKKETLVNYITSFCSQNNLLFKIEFTKHPKHATSIAKSHSDDYKNCVIAVGGDGTVNEVAAGLINAKATFYVIPCGSGNGFARHNNIPLNYKTNLKQLIQYKTSKLIDVGYLNEIPFFNVAGIGFDAIIAKKFSELKGRGLWNYIKAIKNNFSEYKSQVYSFTTPFSSQNIEAFFISFANSTQFGNNFHIAPTADNSDGRIDVVIIKKTKLWNAIKIGIAMLQKKEVKNVTIITQKLETCTLKSNEIHIHIDGEPLLETTNEVNLRIESASLRLLHPDLGD